ncbi:hypothetical protein BGW39_003960, partial [Mortierella sp. 14UC]
EGTPRQQEDPFGAAEDVKSAVTFLFLQEQVDPKRIGILGICAGGGYALFGASADHRIKAVATISGVDLGAFIRSIPKPTLDSILNDAGDARIQFANPDKSTVPPCGAAIESIYDSFAQSEHILPRPVLLIAGSKADTLPYNQKAVELAKEPKRLYVVDGSTHIDLYDRHAPQTYPKLSEFSSGCCKNLSIIQVMHAHPLSTVVTAATPCTVLKSARGRIKTIQT